MSISIVRLSILDDQVSTEKNQYRTLCRITERDCFKYLTPDNCVDVICELYNEASPDYNAIISNMDFEEETEENIKYIKERIAFLPLFSEKRYWVHRAKMKQYPSGSFYAEFRHPLAYQTGAFNNTVYPQGNNLRRVVSYNIEEALIIIKQLNQILAEPDYWLVEGMQRAKERFLPKTIEVFFKPTK
jgi:hypothetical protein